jgi:hypothetical protein
VSLLGKGSPGINPDTVNVVFASLRTWKRMLELGYWNPDQIM